ncbi:hypothetical protein ABTM49_19700, partial [Acinetobacter baumannii]
LFRFDGGVAQIWLPGPLIAARLLALPRAQWRDNALAAVLANMLATGLLGLGWAVALPLALVNMAEAVAAAMIARRLLDAYWPDEPLDLLA